jgi:hypothetical protein
MNKIKNIFNKIFRSDLGLNKYWWHRLVKIVFIVGIFYVAWLSMSEFYYGRTKQVDTLGNRLTNNVQLAGDMLIYGEGFNGHISDSFGLNNGVYCSNNISNKIEEISNITKVNNYGNPFVFEGGLSYEGLKKQLEKNNTVCITNDSVQDGEYRFLGDWSLHMNINTSIDTRDSFQNSLWNIRTMIIYLLMYIFSFYIFYYKIFLYILYGGRKESN